jgi:hypothetical protein
MPLTRRDNDCSPEQVDRNERAASWKSCPLPRPLGRTTPAAGAHRELPPTEGGPAMRLVKLSITRSTERTAEDGERRRLTCPL